MQLFTSIRSRIIALIIAAIVPGIVLALFVAAEERDRASRQVEQSSLAYMRLAEQSLQQQVNSTRTLLSAMARSGQLLGRDAASCKQLLDEVLKITRDYRGFSVSTPDGAVWCISPVPEQPISNAGLEVFERAITTRNFVIGEYQTGRITGKGILTFAYPVLDGTGNVVSVITTGLNTDSLNAAFNALDLPNNYVVDILDRNGTFVVRWPTPEDFVGKTFPEAPITQQILSRGRDGHVTLAQMTGVEGESRLYAFTSVAGMPDNDLFINVGISPRAAYASVDQALGRNLIALAVFAGLVIAGGWLLSDVFITRRTARLTLAARKLSAGDLNARTGLPHTASELGQLANAFDAMADRLQALTGDLEKQVATRTQQLQTSNAKLLESQSELRSLSRRLNDLLEDERTRIAREVHDQIGQALTSIKMDLSAAMRKLSPGDAAVKDKLVSATRLADDTIVIARRISSDLRPGILDNLGLMAAVDWQLREFSERSGVKCNLDADIDEMRLDGDVPIVTYRILQEALTNVARHAQASEVHVQLRTSAEALTLQVQDNGQGIADLRRIRHSTGVLGMRERALRLNGTLDLANLAPGDGRRQQPTTTGTGTVLTMVIPLKAEKTASNVAGAQA